MRVLLAEDEKKVCQFVRKALQECGFAVDTVPDGEGALQAALSGSYDVIVLDIMMPGKDGLSVLRTLRAARNSTPVLILTARGEVSKKVEGLELGADDYVAKPLVMRELVARVNALARRKFKSRSWAWAFGPLLASSRKPCAPSAACANRRSYCRAAVVGDIQASRNEPLFASVFT